MIILIKNRPFLFLTCVSFIFSILIITFNLQYDDRGVGAVSFFIMFISGVTRYMARMLLSGFFEIYVEKFQMIAELAVAITFAFILDYFYLKAFNKWVKK